jgi:UDP-N-acetylglucosamine 4-epimerase
LKWLVTGAAGFIGSHLVEWLLGFDQNVVGIDNFSNGLNANLEEVKRKVGPIAARRFRFIEGDIQDLQTCQAAAKGINIVLHQAALGSVPRSLADPLATHNSNVTGFLNCLIACRDNRIDRFIYASSSAVYGDSPILPRSESNLGRCLSPYAATKVVNEIYADVFGRCYDIKVIGLRYFNVFGPRQKPDGPYAAVIPRWIVAMLKHQPVFINGDGTTSRDFCYIKNVVQANLLAATRSNCSSAAAFNIAGNCQITLEELFRQIRRRLILSGSDLTDLLPIYRDFRASDIRHSSADISQAALHLGYRPRSNWSRQLSETIGWYRSHLTEYDRHE